MSTRTKKPAAADTVAPGMGMKDVEGRAAAALLANYTALADLGRENFAAMLRANAALSEGLEAIGKEAVGYARASFETAAEAAAALLAARTLEDVVQLNSAFAKASFERLVARSAKLSEMGAKLADETLAPLGSRIEATIEKLGKSHTA